MKRRLYLKSIIFCVCWLVCSGALAYTAADYTNAGLQFYNAKNYAQAVPYFTAALGMDPADLKALQGRANCYYFMGKNQEALVDYEKILTANPSGPLSQFVQALKAKIGAAQPAPSAPASSGESAGSSGVAGAAGAEKPAGMGLRLEPAYGMLQFADFNADADTGKKDAAQILAGDPSYEYVSSVPTDDVMVGVEPLVQVGSNFEVGLPFNIIPAGTIASTAKDGTGFNHSVSYAISAFSIGLTGRLLMGQGPFRVFVAAGGLMAPIGINYNDILNEPGFSTQTANGTFSKMAFGGQGQLGLDIHVGEPFVVSLFGGYQLASADGFSGTVTTSGTGTTTQAQGQLGVYDSPNGEKIVFLKDGDPTPTNFRSLRVDLSGIEAGIHFAVFF